MKDIKLVVCQNIKKYRIKKKLTQVELANNARVNYKYLQRIEGKRPPNLTIETIEKLSKALNVRILELLKVK